MKKVTALSGLVLFVFGLTLGITVSFTEDAAAGDICGFLCLYESQCKPNGPDCQMPIEQAWKQALCSGGPLNCSGVSYWVDGACCM